MKIGIAGPMSLDLLRDYLPPDITLPQGYSFPMISVLIQEIIQKGFHVTAYTTSTNLEKPLVIVGEKLTLCIGRRKPHAARDLFLSERRDLIKLIKDNPVDVINAQWSYEFAWAALDSKIPTVITMQDHALTILKGHFDFYRIMRLIMNYIVLVKSKYLIANSPYMFNLLSKKNQKKSKIIPNFINKDVLNEYEANIKKQNYIVSVSNGFGKRKNISNGLKAFKIIKDKYPEFEYRLIGAGMEYGGPAYMFAKQNNLLNGVEFIGAIPFEGVIKELKHALICLHPSLEESFGMSVLESQILGTIVVGGDKSGNIPYLLENGKAGYLCNVKNPLNIAEKISKVISNSSDRTQKEKRAKKNSSQQYAAEKVVNLYLNYFARMNYLQKGIK